MSTHGNCDEKGLSPHLSSVCWPNRSRTSNLPPINFLFAILRRLIGRQAAAFADECKKKTKQLNVVWCSWCTSRLVPICCYFSSQTRFEPNIQHTRSERERDWPYDNEPLFCSWWYFAPWRRADVSRCIQERRKNVAHRRAFALHIRPRCNGKYLSVQLQGLRIRDSEVEYIYDLNNINLSIKHMDLFHLAGCICRNIFFTTFAKPGLVSARRLFYARFRSDWWSGKYLNNRYVNLLRTFTKCNVIKLLSRFVAGCRAWLWTSDKRRKRKKLKWFN